MPTLFQGVHSMQCFIWQDNIMLMSRLVRDDAKRKVRAASSGDELNVHSCNPFSWLEQM